MMRLGKKAENYLHENDSSIMQKLIELSCSFMVLSKQLMMLFTRKRRKQNKSILLTPLGNSELDSFSKRFSCARPIWQIILKVRGRHE